MGKELQVGGNCEEMDVRRGLCGKGCMERTVRKGVWGGGGYCGERDVGKGL